MLCKGLTSLSSLLRDLKIENLLLDEQDNIKLIGNLITLNHYEYLYDTFIEHYNT